MPATAENRSQCTCCWHELARPLMIRKVAEYLGALANPTRARMLLKLSTGECSVGELAASLALSEPVASGHLAILRRVGILQRRRIGSRSSYRLDAPTALLIYERMAAIVESCHR